MNTPLENGVKASFVFLSLPREFLGDGGSVANMKIILMTLLFNSGNTYQ